jgi:hypothetical protein
MYYNKASYKNYINLILKRALKRMFDIRGLTLVDLTKRLGL